MTILNRIKKILLNNGWTDDNIKALQMLKDNWLRVNWLKTIWFNLKALPFSQAIRLPFVIGWNVRILNVGTIVMNTKATPGIVSIAVMHLRTMESNTDKTILCNDGTIIFGGRTKFHPGAKVTIYPNAHLTMGNRVGIGALSKLVCSQSISIGNDVRISWCCQIFDTDFHFLSNIEKNKIYPRRKPIIIEDNVFVGNSCTIGKNTYIPQGSVVSCCSKVSGNYKDEGTNLLFVGNPAKVVAHGFKISNSWFPEIEIEIAKQMNE